MINESYSRPFKHIIKYTHKITSKYCRFPKQAISWSLQMTYYIRLNITVQGRDTVIIFYLLHKDMFSLDRFPRGSKYVNTEKDQGPRL